LFINLDLNFIIVFGYSLNISLYDSSECSMHKKKAELYGVRLSISGENGCTRSNNARPSNVARAHFFQENSELQRRKSLKARLPTS
jgi:hypothetical protein